MDREKREETPMGQGESKPGEQLDRFLDDVSQQQLLRQYGSVNLESASEYSHPATPANTLPQGSILHHPQAGYSQIKRTQRNIQGREDSDQQNHIANRGSKRYQPQKDTTQILEDYAEYANRLINAPYQLYNQYTASDESVYSKNLYETPISTLRFEPAIEQSQSSNVDNNYQFGVDNVRCEYSDNYSVYSNVPRIVISDYDQVLSNKDSSTDVSHNKARQSNTDANFDLDQETDNAAIERRLKECDFKQKNSPLEFKGKTGDDNSYSSMPPCIRHFRSQGTTQSHIAETVETDTEACSTHPLASHQSAVLVEVVESGDNTSEASTLTKTVAATEAGVHLDDDAFGKETKFKQISAINEELRRLAKKYDASKRYTLIAERPSTPQHLSFSHENSPHFPVSSILNKCQSQRQSITGYNIANKDKARRVSLPEINAIDDEDIYDDATSKPLSDTSIVVGSVKNLAKLFDTFAKTSKNPSPQIKPARQKDTRRSQESTIDTDRGNKDNAGAEESVYEEYGFDNSDFRQRSVSEPKGCVAKEDKGVNVDLLPAKHKKFGSLVCENDEMVFRKSKKGERSRHKSDSSTSAVPETSVSLKTSSKRAHKDKKRREGAQEEVVVEQWDSLVTEYEEGDDSRKSKKKQQRSLSQGRKSGKHGVNQTFGRGIVLPVRKAPPGMSAQEIESESGATDMSAHSWVAGGVNTGQLYNSRVQNSSSYDDMHERTYAKQRMYDARQGHSMNASDRKRLSSQSSQYTSDGGPLFYSPQSRMLRSDLHRVRNELDSNQRLQKRQIHSDMQYSGEYRSLPMNRKLHAHMDSLSPRYYSSANEHVSSPESLRYNRRNIQTANNGYVTSPETNRRYRLVATNAPHLHSSSHSNIYSLGQNNTRYASDRVHSPRRHRALSVPREIWSFQRYQDDSGTLSGQQLKLKQRSLSHDHLDYDSAPVSSHQHSSSQKKKIVRIKEKKSKKSLDQRAKRVVDDIIDEALYLIGPKKNTKKGTKLESKRSRSQQRNVIHTTNVFNEIHDVDADKHRADHVASINRSEHAATLNRAQLQHQKGRRYHSDQEAYYSDQRELQHLEEELRASRQLQRKPSLMRSVYSDSHALGYSTSSLRPVPGSGTTREGNLPPPRSAYRNYDYELSVGQPSHRTQEKYCSLDITERNKHTSSGSEYSLSHRGHYRRDKKSTKYPNISFGPMRSRSEENLLLEKRGTSPKRSSLLKIKPRNPKFTGTKYDYGSEPENTKKINPSTLSRGLVTKIMHKWDQDVKRAFTRKENSPDRFKGVVSDSDERQVLRLDNSHWANASTASYSPRTEASFVSPSSASCHLSPHWHPAEDNTNTGGNVKVQLGPEATGVTQSEIHARFKVRHDTKPEISLQIPKDGMDTAWFTSLGSGTESWGNKKYGTFSNEEMTVADVHNQFNNGQLQSSTDSVYRKGDLYGTQPDISMSKQQTLNMFLFNQQKPTEKVLDGDEQSITLCEQLGAELPEIDTEMKDFYIYHKGTQTLESEPKTTKKTSKSERTKYVIVQQPSAHQTPQHVETTHYITQQREIEKIPQEKVSKSTSIQTDPEPKKKRPPTPKKPTKVEVSSYMSAPVITQSRHIEKHNYEIGGEKPVPKQVPVIRREIPIEFEEVVHQEEEREKSEDEETVILETTEIEEKEQRIQMSIFEEYEFSHKRVEDGKTVTVTETEGEKSDIPNFWTPNKYEVVVDKKKKKSTQVKETTKDDEHRLASGLSSQLALKDSADHTEGKQGGSVMVSKGESARIEDTFTQQAQENLAALEQVLEQELLKKSADKNAKNIKQKAFKTEDEYGRLNETEYVAYSKTVPLDESKASESNKHRPTERSMFSHEESKRSKSSDIEWLSDGDITSDRKTSKMISSSRPGGRNRSSHSVLVDERPSTRYRDSYVSLFSAQPYVANRVYGRAGSIHNNWQDRMRQNGEVNEFEYRYNPEEEAEAREDITMHISREKTENKQRRSVERNQLPALSTFLGDTHTEQKGPSAKTRYEKDPDGNMVKITEWEHTVTKTVNRPAPESDKSDNGASQSHRLPLAFNELPEDGYINMNLHEITSASPSIHTGSEDEDVASQSHLTSRRNITEVSGETEITRKPVQFETIENSVDVDDRPRELAEETFLYDLKRAQLKRCGKQNRSFPHHMFTDIMSTQL